MLCKDFQHFKESPHPLICTTVTPDTYSVRKALNRREQKMCLFEAVREVYVRWKRTVKSFILMIQDRVSRGI